MEACGGVGVPGLPVWPRQRLLWHDAKSLVHSAVQGPDKRHGRMMDEEMSVGAHERLESTSSQPRN